MVDTGNLLFRFTFYLFIVLGVCMSQTINAQRLNVKPLIGIADNGTIHTGKASNTFAQSAFSRPRLYAGILLSYNITPKWSIETGFVHRGLSVAADVLNPQTKNKIGYFSSAVALRYYQLNITKEVKTLSANFSLKTIAGIEFINKGTGYRGNTKTTAIDSLVLPNYFPANLSPLDFNNTNNWTYGVNIGLGTTWKVKQKSIAELRVCAAYQAKPLHGIFMSASVNGVQQIEEFRATQLNYNVSILINMITLLGAKWRD